VQSPVAWIWLGIKTFLVVHACSFGFAPPSRVSVIDQIMRLGWKIFIPVTLVWLVVVGVWMHSPLDIWE
jgi:NADH-quinone oxidoreductase subunit H